MRRFILLILVAGVATFVFAHRKRMPEFHTLWIENDPVVVANSGGGRVETSRIVIQKPTFKRTKRVPNREPSYTFTVNGWAPTPEEAKKDALEQATRVVQAALELKHAPVSEKRLEKLIVESEDPSEVPLGSSDGKDLGPGKHVALTLELPNDFIQELNQTERSYRTEDRMGWLARGLAVIVAGLFAISGYVRLDEWSKGYFSGALKAAAALAVIGAGAAVYYTSIRW
jgi:hypothetical protein